MIHKVLPIRRRAACKRSHAKRRRAGFFLGLKYTDAVGIDNRMADGSFDVSALLSSFGVNLMKYLVEGLAVAIAMAFVSQKIVFEKILTVALVAMAVLALLDFFTPGIGASSRQGIGLGLGVGITGGLPVAM